MEAGSRPLMKPGSLLQDHQVLAPGSPRRVHKESARQCFPNTLGLFAEFVIEEMVFQKEHVEVEVRAPRRSSLQPE